MVRAALSGSRTSRSSIRELPEPVLAGAGLAVAEAAHAATGAPHGYLDHAHHDHAHQGHTHDAGWGQGHSHGRVAGRGGLIGMGVAGGLVPSPSALVVLLASIGLGRTVFGVSLVLAYGLGMAATLTGAGFLLVRMRGRLERRAADLRRRRWLTRLVAATPVLTATLVLLVGLALVTRGLVLTA
jgi:ABC-type nickel/cobalt efflux system permease component RcnA